MVSVVGLTDVACFVSWSYYMPLEATVEASCCSLVSSWWCEDWQSSMLINCSQVSDPTIQLPIFYLLWANGHCWIISRQDTQLNCVTTVTFRQCQTSSIPAVCVCVCLVVEMSAGKCKRVAATSSSDDDSPRSDDTSVTTATEPSSPTPAHEYDVSSPGSSSTLSGGASSVSHAPGFSHSSQQQTLRRSRVKKKKADVNVRVGAGILCCHSEQTNTQLEPSRLAKHHVTPRSKPARGIEHPMNIRHKPSVSFASIVL